VSPSLPSPACGLAWAQIFIEEVSLHDCSKALESVPHGDWSGRFVAGVAGPAAEAGDGPGGPSESSGWIRILLFSSASLQPRLQCGQHLQLAIVKDVRCRLAVMWGDAREHELHRLAGSDQRDNGQFFEGFAVGNDAFLNVDPWRLTVRNSCSTCQRWRYQPIMVTACATVSTSWVVSRRQ
jgi:hypothetical protein